MDDEVERLLVLDLRLNLFSPSFGGDKLVRLMAVIIFFLSKNKNKNQPT